MDGEDPDDEVPSSDHRESISKTYPVYFTLSWIWRNIGKVALKGKTDASPCTRTASKWD